MDSIHQIPFIAQAITLNLKGISAGLLPRQKEALESGCGVMATICLSSSAFVVSVC